MTNDCTGRLARWQALLSCYDFTVKYLPGKKNIVADSLTRVNYSTPSACLAALQQMDEFEDLALRKDHKDILPADMVFYANKAHPGASRKEPKLVEAKKAEYRRVMVSQWERDIAECCEEHFAEEAAQHLKEYEADKAAIRDEDGAEHECYCCQAHAAPAVRTYVEDQGVETALEEEETSPEPVGASEGSGPDSRLKVGVQVEDGTVRIASVEAWRQCQREDEEYKDLIRYFMAGDELLLTDVIRKQMKTLAWRDGLLWYKGKAAETANNPEKWVLWVPAKLR